MEAYGNCSQIDDIEELIVPFFKTTNANNKLDSSKLDNNGVIKTIAPDNISSISTSSKIQPSPAANGSCAGTVRTLVNGKKRIDPDLLDHQADSFVPGTRRIYMKTWGCSHNSSDSEYMAGILDRAGYRIQFSNPDSADLWLLNSCTVKTPSETQLQNDVRAALDSGIRVVVAGCVSQAAPQTEWFRGLSLIGVQQIDRVLEVVEETLKGNSVRLMGKRGGKMKGDGAGGAPLTLPKIRKNPLIEILAINTGCLNRCTYCKTKHARGDLASYSIDQLVDRARTSFAEGVKELWLTSEDLGAYGHDIGVRLSDLLARLVEVIPEGCMMRMGMTNPPYILHQLDAIADVLNHPRVYAFIHIPVQAASDRVLDDMRREYTVADFRTVCDHLRAHVPGVTIATDVICGFPTETPDDFEETMALVREYKFPVLFINQYYPRPGTPSAKMKRIDTVEVKRRTKALSALFRSYQPYENRLGEQYDVLVTEEASDGEQYVGHNKWYEQILLPKLPGLMGRRVRVEILKSFSKWSMNGRVVKWYSESGSSDNKLKGASSPNDCLTKCVKGLLSMSGLSENCANSLWERLGWILVGIVVCSFATILGIKFH